MRKFCPFCRLERNEDVLSFSDEDLDRQICVRHTAARVAKVGNNLIETTPRALYSYRHQAKVKRRKENRTKEKAEGTAPLEWFEMSSTD
jgi:hypothetical protein